MSESTSSASTRRNMGERGISTRKDKKSSLHHSRTGSMESGALEKVEKEDQTKAASTILHWSNNLVRIRVISVTKCFYKWKYYIPAQPVAPVAYAPTPVKQSEAEEDLAEQKHSYLLLFAENEKLREQLTDLRKSTASKEKKLRVSAMKSCISVILRSRCNSKLRYYYDIWFNTAKSINLMTTTTQRTFELDVGLQRVESERNYVKQLEATNGTLRLTLVYTIFFYKWKLNSALMKLASERRLSKVQRETVYTEIQRIRSVVSASNNQEVSLLNNALVRGDKLSANVIALKNQIDTIASVAASESKESSSSVPAAVPKDEGGGKVTASGHSRSHSHSHSHSH